MNSGFNQDYDDVKAQAAAEALSDALWHAAVFSALRSTQNPIGFDVMLKPFTDAAPMFSINGKTEGCESGLFTARNFPWQGEGETEAKMNIDECVMWAKRRKEGLK